MKLTKDNKGFTLIELIMVIVIMGILAAVVVPKFFDFTTKAYDANEEAVIGAIKAGLNLYAADQLINQGSRKFPKADDIETDGDFSDILDEEPDAWSVVSSGSGSDDKVEFHYTDPDPDVKYRYECSGGSTYTLTEI